MVRAILRGANRARLVKPHIGYTAMDIAEGGTSIPYWMEDPFIRKQYDAILEQNRAQNRMDPQFYDRAYKGELPRRITFTSAQSNSDK